MAKSVNVGTLKFRGIITDISNDHFTCSCSEVNIGKVVTFLNRFRDLTFVPRIGKHGVRVKFNPTDQTLTKVSGDINLDYLLRCGDAIVEIAVKCKKNQKRITKDFTSSSISFIATSVDIVPDDIEKNLDKIKFI
jgi:hypothetical protein